MEFQKTILFLRIHLRLVFCLISLVSSFAKEETRETRRKEKKEERRAATRAAHSRPQIRQYRICWSVEICLSEVARPQNRCCSDIVFVVVLFSDSIPFPQSSPKTMVFSHCFPEFGLGSPGPFSKGLGGCFSKSTPRLLCAQLFLYFALPIDSA